MNTKLVRSIVTLLVQLTAILTLSGCAQPPVQEASATAEAGYGRAFGRVEFIDEGKEAVWTSTLFADALTLFVRSTRGGEVQYFDIEGDGSFYWPLKAGEYELVGYQLTRTAAGTPRKAPGRLMLRFSVPQAGQAVYIGNLRIETVKGRYRFSVFDRHAAALERVRAQVASGKLQAAKELMRAEDAGRFKRITRICGASWGIECDQTYQGVRPLNAAHFVAETQTLTPLLEWQPSTRSEVTYDVAIYELMSFMYGLNGSVDGLRSTRVAYVEGLREPRYTPAPLEPGRNYVWTVRLRDGDTVSDWSTTSYSFFAVFVWGRGSGQYFGLPIPAR